MIDKRKHITDTQLWVCEDCGADLSRNESHARNCPTLATFRRLIRMVPGSRNEDSVYFGEIPTVPIPPEEPVERD